MIKPIIKPIITPITHRFVQKEARFLKLNTNDSFRIDLLMFHSEF
jgi:hypothetical protein